MPKRTDIKKILLIGSGPIVIGQACEFDYSGTQACRALRAEGYEVVLVNSNPATIMTDPQTADKSYIEPLTVERLEKIIEKERPQALLPTLGGQTALNLALALEQAGVLEKYQIEMLGADKATIERAENREQFAQIVEELGLEMCKAQKANNMEEAWAIQAEIGYPCLIRASFTLGGEGSGVVKNAAEFEEVAKTGLKASRITEIMIEPQLEGWKEFELEMMADQNQNVVVICGIENLDPLGIHTGDSITVAPIQTLSNRQYQKMRDASIALMQAVGVRTGGANIQYTVCPKTGKMLVIEMNPRVSRSSALASKATGYPIAKFAAKLAVGYTLDELVNDITQKTACFEPSLDYCVVKFPRFNLDKFEGNYPLGTSMRAIGEVMAIGSTFKSAFSKGLRALEEKNPPRYTDPKQLENPDPTRIHYLLSALEQGVSLDFIQEKSKIDPWFLHQLKELVQLELPKELDYKHLLKAKQWGLTDKDIAQKTALSVEEVTQKRKEWKIQPTYKLVDSCSAEFEAFTPYYYSTFEQEDESFVDDNPKVMIIGSGANRIGQGIEFDYSCVQAAECLSKMGYSSIMVNSNPETVSTDYDISDKLYFEPLSFEEVYAIYEKEKPEGIILQLGGQTPFQLLDELAAAGVPILGTTAENIALAEDRKLFSELVAKLNMKQSQHASVDHEQALYQELEQIGLPLLMRPSFVIGGTQMKVVYNHQELKEYLKQEIEFPLQLDEFLEDAVELDVDLISDGQEVVICGIMEQIQAAGVHSGDSAAIWPTYSLSQETIADIETLSKDLALALQIKGFLNIQLAWKDGQIYILEANPRASRTIPFLCKAQGVNWVEVATAVMLSKPLMSLDWAPKNKGLFAVKEVVFPFAKFDQSPVKLDVQMRSTGEVMGQDKTAALAYYKAKMATLHQIPLKGKVFVQALDQNLQAELEALGLGIAEELEDANWLISIGRLGENAEGLALRRAAYQKGILITTNQRELDLSLKAIQEMQHTELGLYPLQEQALAAQL